MRRFVAGFFQGRVAGQLAQVLAVGRRVLVQQFGQRRVAFGDQPVAPVFDLVQGLRLAPVVGLVVVERGADRVQGLGLFPAQVFGQELHLPLVGDLRGDALRRPRQVAQVLVHRDLHQARLGLFDQALGQFKHGQRIAAFFAAAWAELTFVFVELVFFVHRPPSVQGERIRP